MSEKTLLFQSWEKFQKKPFFFNVEKNAKKMHKNHSWPISVINNQKEVENKDQNLFYPQKKIGTFYNN
jgi:carbamate kinase